MVTASYYLQRLDLVKLTLPDLDLQIQRRPAETFLQVPLRIFDPVERDLRVVRFFVVHLLIGWKETPPLVVLHRHLLPLTRLQVPAFIFYSSVYTPA